MNSHINHNGEIRRHDDAYISPNNRGFSFGDGFFESCLFENGLCKLWKFHKERIKKALNTLGLNLELDIELLYKEVERVIDTKSIERVKIIFYRKGAGAYTPLTSDCGYLISANTLEKPLIEKQKLNCDFANEIYVYSSSLGIKTLSSLNYVRAAIEKKERGLDDLILVNEKEEITEATASNIWWVKDEIIYTPSEASGGVSGVYKQFLTSVLKQEGIVCQPGQFKKNDLLDADEVFLTNAIQGIKPVIQVADVFFKTQIVHYLVDKVSY
ncbi:MAG: aminotransferase class IV [Bacteroidia bacterium]